MAAAGKFRYAYLALLSKPREDRLLYRLAKRRRVTRLVELGVGSLERSLNLISVCQRYSPGAKIAYTALDWFEERPADEAPLSLIDAHRRMHSAGAAARLMPGGPTRALPAVANSLLGTDLVLIAPGVADAALATIWFYVPRLLHADSLVLRAVAQGEAGHTWREVPSAEIEALAAARQPAKAA